MRDIIISDLHFAGDPAVSDFTGPNELADVVERADRLTIAGDAAELWQDDPQSCRQVWELRSWLLLRRRLEMLAERGRLQWLVGNHDAVGLAEALPEMLAACIVGTTVQIENGGRIIWVEHGSRGDPWNRGRAAVIGRSVAAVGGALERLGWRDVDLAWDKWWGQRYPSRGSERGISVVERWAIQRLEDLRRAGLCEVMVFAHIHRPGEIVPGLYNCGCWVNGRREWVEIHDGTVEVRGGE